ncbi:MAG: DPP IV N-terminal domain-containing protein [Bacteroidia bacterium]|nr:DPP IV N-terminal domain-containing protein [Bacteroidia bacterium]
MRYTLTTLCFLFVLTGSQAQEKKLTLEEAVLKQRTTLAPKRLPQLQWLPTGADFSYVDTRNNEEVLVRGHALKSERTEVLRLSGLNKLLAAVPSDTLPKLPLMKWRDNTTLTFEQGKKVWSYQTSSGVLSLKDSITVPEGAEASERSQNGSVAYVEGNNVFMEKDHRRIQITRDGSYEIVNGKSVHREEFGIDKGLFWSPDGNKLAFYRMDQSMVTDYPLVNFSEKPAKQKAIKYPFAGDKSHQVTLGVYDLASGNTIFLKTGEPAEQYLTNIAWSPDEKYIYIAVLNREQNHMNLNQYDASNGAFIKTLFEEHDNKYTEPLHPPVFVSGNATQFIWQSRRDGWNHLYLYEHTGKLIRQLTKGEWEVSGFDGFDAKGKKAFFHATGNTGINRDFYSVELASGKVTRLTREDGVHGCIASADKTLFIDTYSSPLTPRVIQVLDAGGKVLNVLLKAENPLKEYAIGSTRLFTIKAEDGTPLWCRMILPAAFDSTRRYPVIVYVYGGPHAQMITNSWLAGADLWFHYLTQQGYIVFTLDNRGSAWRGKAFEQQTYRRLGDLEMNDQISGVNYLRKLPFVDGNRLGLNGWSFGGFMTTSLMTRFPGIFKAGVAGGPVIDWSHYEVMYTERYMDTPEENPGGYKLSNLTNYVDQLNGRLLLIHGTSDDVVVWQHSLMYLKKAISKGVQLDYFVYPGHLHNVTGKDRVHLNDKITRYFNDFLK